MRSVRFGADEVRITNHSKMLSAVSPSMVGVLGSKSPETKDEVRMKPGL